jgi:hypothetical protein
VRANPGLVTPLPWIENMAPALANMFFPGSATANYYDLIWGQYGGSDADATHAIDRVKSAAFPNCIIKTGCYTMYPTQSSGMSMWTNAGYSNFNGATFALRKAYSKGISFDVNYTLSHSMDNGGAPGRRRRGWHHAQPLRPRLVLRRLGFRHPAQRNSNVLFEARRGKPVLGNAGA